MNIKSNNKGFTLVELVIALAVMVILMSEVSMLMYNSTKLYQNASRETDLQGEAQRVSTILEELLVDVDKEVSFNSIDTNTDMLKVKKTEPGSPVEHTYEMYIANWRLDDDGIGGHGDLFVKYDGGTPELLANNVELFKVNMAEYESANKVNITFSFNDGKYEYGKQGAPGTLGAGSFSKDYYIRNELAASGAPTVPDIEDNDIDVDLLRFQELDLNFITQQNKAIYGLGDADSFTFDIAGGVAVPGSTKLKDVTSSGLSRLVLDTASNKLALLDNINTDYDYKTDGSDEDHSKIVINASFASSDCFKVTVGIKPVKIAMSASEDSVDNTHWASTYDTTTDHPNARRTGELVYYDGNAGDGSASTTSIALMEGIDVNAAKSKDGSSFADDLKADIFFEKYSGVDVPIGSNGFSVNEKTGFQVVLRDMMNGISISGMSSDDLNGMRYQDLAFYRKPYDNALAFQSKLFNTDSKGFNSAMESLYKQGRIVCRVKMYFLNSSGAQVGSLTCRSYLIPLGDCNSSANKLIPSEFFDNLMSGLYH